MGILIGLLFPVIIFLGIYFFRFTDEDSLTGFIPKFFSNKGYITFFGVWFLVGNIALFTYYVNTNKDRTAKGVFAITLLYGIGILLAKVLI